MDCRVVQRHLSAYVDGELEPSPMLELEEHLAACVECKVEADFLQALKREVKVRMAPGPAQAQLRARVVEALASVRPEAEADHRGQHLVTAAAIAASVLLVLGSVFGTDRSNVERAERVDAAAVVPAGLDIARDVVDRHKDDLPTEIATQAPEQATSWFRDKLSFRVRAVEFTEPGVRFLGARISQVGPQQAAKLYYSVGDSRLTLVVFKAPPTLQHVFSSQRELARWGAQQAHVGERDVTYHTLQGYTVPILQQNGLVYAFAGDLDQASLLRLVASARIPR